MPSKHNVNRREFLKKTGVAAAGVTAGLMASGNFAYAAPSETLRVGLVGCGGRGKGAARDAVVAADGVELVALADLFEDQVETAKNQLREAVGDKYKVTPEHTYVGWDAYKQLIHDDAVNYIVLATPGSFRPLMLEEAVSSGKHTFAEKPVSVDPVGCRKVMDLSEQARQKGMGIAVGTQRRHIDSYLQAMERVQDGAIGDIMGGRIYFNVQGLRYDERRDEWTDMEYQIRNFRLYTHLSGDCPLELLIHQVDVANWVMGDHPVSVTATGGRETAENLYETYATLSQFFTGSPGWRTTRRRRCDSWGTSVRTACFTGMPTAEKFAQVRSARSVRSSLICS